MKHKLFKENVHLWERRDVDMGVFKAILQCRILMSDLRTRRILSFLSSVFALLLCGRV